MRGLRVAASLAVAVVVLTLAMGVAAADPVPLNPAENLDGDGTAGDPYIVTNASELQAIQEDLTAQYKLGTDIDASQTAEWNDGDGFDPIGDSVDRFSGTFDGDEKTISNLSIDRGTEEYVGLFGAQSNQASIKRVGLEDVTIDGDATVGGLVGYSSGTVADSYVTGTVDGGDSVGGVVGQLVGGTVTGSHTTVTVDGSYAVGGLVGYQSGGAVRTSNTAGTVNGWKWVGGVVGYNRGGDVSTSYATSTVDGNDAIGGLVGTNSNDGDVTESYATGAVYGAERVGGVIGENGGKYAESDTNTGGTVNESYATGAVDGTTDVGGLVGFNDDGTVTDAYWNTESTGQTDSAGGGEGLTTDRITGINATRNMAFDFDQTWYVTSESPEFTEYEHEGRGTEDDPYEIGNVDELQLIPNNLTANYTLTRDIDASGAGEWNDGDGFDPIGSDSTRFTGHFDGDGYTISGLYINRPNEDYVGLFGDVDGSIVDVTVDDVEINGRDIIGGLVGMGRGPITHSTVSGTVTGTDGNVGGLVGRLQSSEAILTNNSAHVDVAGENSTVGGLVGFNDGSEVSMSYATGSVDGSNEVGGLVGNNTFGTVRESYATGSVDSSFSVGGLVGFNDGGEVRESSATGSVNGTNVVGGLVGANSGAVSESYATGSVTGSYQYVGGLVGTSSEAASVDNAYWDIESTNQSDSDGGTGLTTAQMTGFNATESNNMGALDFATMWTATDDYPLLRWSVADLDLALADNELVTGETTTATVTVTTVDDREIGATTTSDYSSSASSVARVDANGTVTAERSGNTDLKAELGSKTDTVAVAVSNPPRSSPSRGSSGSGSAPPRDSGTTVDIELNDDGSVSATHSALAGQAVSVTLGDSVRDDASGTRYNRVDFTFGEDIEVTFSARSTNRDELPDGMPQLGTGESTSNGGSGSDRAISYVEFTVSADGVDASDRVSSSTIEFDVSTNTLAERGLESEAITLNRYNEDAGEWAELDTEVIEESDGEITYESTTPGFSMFAVSERAPSDVDESIDDPTESTETADDTPGFGVLVAVVSLLGMALLLGRRRS